MEFLYKLTKVNLVTSNHIIFTPVSCSLNIDSTSDDKTASNDEGIEDEGISKLVLYFILKKRSMLGRSINV